MSRRGLCAIAAVGMMSSASPSAGAAVAADVASADDVCAAPATIGRLAAPLARTRAALAVGRPLRIVALGSSSTAGAGASADRFSYPSRLAVELAKRSPTATIEIINRGVNGEDARENLERLQSDVIAVKPDLVVWQMGTNAVLHDVDDDDFDRSVQQGLDALKAAGIEVLLMDLQYAPRVVEAPGHERMLLHFESIGARNRLPVFHRYALMHFWADRLQARYVGMLSSDGLHLNDTSYGCLAERLADAIVGDGPVGGSRDPDPPSKIDDRASGDVPSKHPRDRLP